MRCFKGREEKIRFFQKRSFLEKSTLGELPRKKTNYVLACTCKKTNPKPNPKSVITKQTTAVVIISPIFFYKTVSKLLMFLLVF